ncbi:MAG: lytic transglycosylase domain-containing protein [Candidatus Velthaea sp.]
MPRSIAAVFAACALWATPALAQDTHPDVATILRSINPHLSVAASEAYGNSVLSNARRANIDPRLLVAIVTVESHWSADAVSRVGARGLGQLMPLTARNLNVNPRDWGQNLRGTASYLRSLLNRFATWHDSSRLAIAGYNAGPNAIKRYGGVPPYGETQHYVVKVLRVWQDLDARVGRAWATKPSRRSLARRFATDSDLPIPPPAAPSDDDFVLAHISALGSGR